jgi:hypothetical protein
MTHINPVSTALPNAEPDQEEDQEKTMAEHFIPQSYPMWAVIEDMHGEAFPGWCLVVGWAPDPDEPGAYTAVLADCASPDVAAYTAKPGDRMLVHLFADRDEAGELRGGLARGVADRAEREETR